MQQGARGARVCHSGADPGPGRGSTRPNSWGGVTRSQDGRGGRDGHGGSTTQEICGGPPSTDGDEGAAWNLDDDEEPGREGSIIDI